jgi:hypothetical protein
MSTKNELTQEFNKSGKLIYSRTKDFDDMQIKALSNVCKSLVGLSYQKSKQVIFAAIDLSEQNSIVQTFDNNINSQL